MAGGGKDSMQGQMQDSFMRPWPPQRAPSRQGGTRPLFYAHSTCKPASRFYNPPMPKKSVLTITEFARMGGRATLRKYGKRQLRAWGKLGGRPRSKSTPKDKRGPSHG